MNSVIMITQFFFTLVIGMYFFTKLRNEKSDSETLANNSKKEAEHLNCMRHIHLSEPVTETARPKNVNEIIGQDDGIRAIKAALCGPDPQHILIYGPAGVGKTAAARVALECAKKSNGTPFSKNAKFIETDATIMRYDERSIADPLIGSVHDPIYQGAGAYGVAGVPQVKEGAVSKAHGGVLFIDEIGELQTCQINKLLKVLEDRRVMFESAYYSEENKKIHIILCDTASCRSGNRFCIYPTVCRICTCCEYAECGSGSYDCSRCSGRNVISDLCRYPLVKIYRQQN